MREEIKGHLYHLDNLKSSGDKELKFYMDPDLHEGQGQVGTSTQEVLRACIARVKALDTERPHPTNQVIIGHLREAIIGFEVRALEMKLRKTFVENLQTNEDGHTFTLNKGACYDLQSSKYSYS